MNCAADKRNVMGWACHRALQSHLAGSLENAQHERASHIVHSSVQRDVDVFSVRPFSVGERAPRGHKSHQELALYFPATALPRRPIAGAPPPPQATAVQPPLPLEESLRPPCSPIPFLRDSVWLGVPLLPCNQGSAGPEGWWAKTPPPFFFSICLSVGGSIPKTLPAPRRDSYHATPQ